MKHVSELRDPGLARRLLERIAATSTRPLHLMEVCGTHTVAISRSGIRQLVPRSIRLLSGPGCPVCVTAQREVDAAIALARQPGVILTTFGDMMRVPGTESSLQREVAAGRQVRVVYSPLDALKLAEAEPERLVVFFGVGFETTTPTVAVTVREARRRGQRNFLVYSAHKLFPPAMQALLDCGEIEIHGFICPGHVSTIIGAAPYAFIPERYGRACVISGFEPLDILQSILMLAEQRERDEARVEIQYTRAVRPGGNPQAVQAIMEVFTPADGDWRGLGVIPGTGLVVREEYADWDAARRFTLELPEAREPHGCRCGEVLRGVISPLACALFARRCTPQDPVGPCMVSSEGTCAAYYRYERGPASAQPSA